MTKVDLVVEQILSQAGPSTDQQKYVTFLMFIYLFCALFIFSLIDSISGIQKMIAKISELSCDPR